MGFHRRGNETRSKERKKKKNWPHAMYSFKLEVGGEFRFYFGFLVLVLLKAILRARPGSLVSIL